MKCDGASSQLSWIYSTLSRRFMDEEHEREIVEREKRSRMKSARPDIVHPIDLNTAAVEVVTIRPNAAGARNLINKRHSASYHFGHPQPQQQQNELLQADIVQQQHQRVFEKHKTASVHKNSSSVCPKVIAASSSKARVDYADSKDSGHETSSIHTENSDSASNSSNDGGSGSAGGGSHGASSQHSRTPSGSENGYASTVSRGTFSTVLGKSRIFPLERDGPFFIGGVSPCHHRDPPRPTVGPLYS